MPAAALNQIGPALHTPADSNSANTALALLFTLNLWLGIYNQNTGPAEWPWAYVFLMMLNGFFVIHAAGRSLGLDALLRRHPVGPLANARSSLTPIYQAVS